VQTELVIVGGGPAGLSAALVAGRARRHALLVDGGLPRNAVAREMHTFVTRDGIAPQDFRRAAHEELSPYATVRRLDGSVASISGEIGAFTVGLQDGTTLAARRILLALGLVDTLPAIAGVREHWGRGVHACVYCDGFEHRDTVWGVLAENERMCDYALFLKNWASQVVVFSNGSTPPGEKRSSLQAAGIEIVPERIARIQGGSAHSLQSVELEGGRQVAVETFWVRPAQSQTPLVQSLKLELADNFIRINERNETSRPGIHAAGDCAGGPVQQAILAAAHGTRAAFLIVQDLVAGPR
jgi:thioredoxin reductase